VFLGCGMWDGKMLLLRNEIMPIQQASKHDISAAWSRVIDGL
jgi:hypothetical protein